MIKNLFFWQTELHSNTLYGRQLTLSDFKNN